MLANCPEHLKKFVLTWKRYIDDIFLLWLGTISQLEEFHTYLNSVHPTMKFDKPEFDRETNSCNFLDLNICVKPDGKIVTDLYKKKTSIPSALLPSSAHPAHTSKSIVFSMAFRLLRICSTPDLLDFRLTELQNDVLIPRNYKPSAIKKVFEEIKSMDRTEALKKKIKEAPTETSRIVVPMDYNPELPNQGKVLRKHHRAMIIKNK